MGHGIGLYCLTALECKWCESLIDSEHKKEVDIAVKLFGLSAGWRLCRCGESLVGKRKVAMVDRRGVRRTVYRRVVVDPLDRLTVPLWAAQTQ